MRESDEESSLFDEDPKDSEDLEEEDLEEDEEEQVTMKTPSVPRKPRKKPPVLPPAQDDRDLTVNWYLSTLKITGQAARHLYDSEDLTKPSVWAKLDDKTLSQIMKGCRDATIHVPVLSFKVMQLLVFLCKHHERIQRPLLDLCVINEDMLIDIERQKQLEEQYIKTKDNVDPASLNLDDASVTKSIGIVERAFRSLRGIEMHPLRYVIRPDPDVPPAHDDLPFGAPDSRYISYDDEMISRGAIYSREVNCNEDSGPFHKRFLIDNAIVFVYLEKVFSKSGFWVNVKQHARKQDGRKVWRTLIKFFFGHDRAITIAEQCRAKLNDLVFSGPRKGFDFTKYCNMHTEQHRIAADLLQYQTDQTEVFSDQNKCFAFQKGITDPYFSPIKAIVNTQRHAYTFETMKEAYLNFMRNNPRPNNVPHDDGRRRISHTQTGIGRPKSGEMGKGKKPTQAEIDACTNITLKKYKTPEYDKFTPAEKAKLFQLRKAAEEAKTNAGKRGVSQVETDKDEEESFNNSTNPALERGTIKKTKKEKE